MLVNSYDPQSSRKLAASIVAGAGSPLRSGSPADARVVNVGGGWHLSTWREDLRRLTNRGAVTALAMRTLSNERQLSDQDWARVTRGMADQGGLADRPWAAVRTSATTVALLTDASHGPLRVDAARTFARAVTTRYRLGAQAAPRGAADGSIAATNAGAVLVTQSPPPSSVAQLSFAEPAAAPATGAVAAAPVSAPAHQPANRPHTR
jgi:hypothetical protein